MGEEMINKSIGSRGVKDALISALPDLHPLFSLQDLHSLLWKLADLHQLDKNGRVLVLNCQVGEGLASASPAYSITAVEPDALYANEIRQLYPHMKIYSAYLDQLFSGALAPGVTELEDYPYAMVLAYPPNDRMFGADYPKPPLPIDILLIYLSMQLLEEGGLLILFSNILKERDDFARLQVALTKLCSLEDVYALPPAFNATATPPDILVLRKKPTIAEREKKTII